MLEEDNSPSNSPQRRSPRLSRQTEDTINIKQSPRSSPRQSPRRSPRQSPQRNTPTNTEPTKTRTKKSSWHVIPANDEFVWFYAVKATQPSCFVQTCGMCGPPYAAKQRFSPEESKRIEACYLHTLSGLGGQNSGVCPHNRIDFKTMQQTTAKGTREVYRERASDTVVVEGFGSVLRTPLPCPRHSQ